MTKTFCLKSIRYFKSFGGTLTKTRILDRFKMGRVGTYYILTKTLFLNEGKKIETRLIQVSYLYTL